METEQNETVVDKAVAFVKDMFGIKTEAAREVEVNPEYHDSAPEVTAENAMHLNPNAYGMSSVGEINPDSYVAPIVETDAERLRRDAGLREKSALELNAESARAEDGG